MVFLLLSLVALVSLAIIWITRRSDTKWKRAPGPPALPVVGHLHMMVKPGATPHTLLQSLARRYGPVMSLQFGGVPVVVASTAAAAKEFLKTHDAIFASRPRLTAGRIIAYESDLVFTNGEQWRRMRRLTMTELFTPRRVEMFKGSRAEEVRELCYSLLKSPGELVDLRDKLKIVAFNIVTYMLMHKRYYGKKVENQDEAKEFIHVNDDLCHILGCFPLGDYFPALRFIDPVERKMKSLHKSIDKFLDSKIAEKERDKQRIENDDMDFLDILLDLRDKGEEHLQRNTLKGLMINLFSAGSDTTAVTLEWALAEVMKHPEVMSKAQEEIGNVVGPNRMVNESDLPHLPYINAIVKESFRLHPPIPILVPHSSTQESSVMGYKIPNKSTLLVNVYAIGRDESVWEKPLEFKPERFLGTEMDVKGQDFGVIPFGAGRRMCPGISVALLGVHLTLANLVHGFEWEASVDTESEEYGLSLIMTKKLEAVPRPRLSSHAYSSWA